MLSGFLAIGFGVCAIGWFTSRAAVLALVEWIYDKGYAPPTSEEVKAHTEWATRRMLGLK